jgi:hypothetical protein
MQAKVTETVLRPSLDIVERWTQHRVIIAFCVSFLFFFGSMGLKLARLLDRSSAT